MRSGRSDPDRLLQRMAALCARSEQCSFDIGSKLRRAGLPDADVRNILDRLKADGFIDDRRYAGSFARDKVRFSGWGKLKIRMALASKRLPALDSISSEDYRKAWVSAATLKARTLDLADHGDRTKLMRYLATRGFEGSVCSAAVAYLVKKTE